MDKLFETTNNTITDNTDILILSNHKYNQIYTPIPTLLTVTNLHHHLIHTSTHTKTNLIIESNKPHKIHHFYLLINYNTQTFNPYIIYKTLNNIIKKKLLKKTTLEKTIINYNKTIIKNIIKIISKINISTIQTYHNTQIFETINIDQKIINKYFTKTTSHIKNINLDMITKKITRHHNQTFLNIPLIPTVLNENNLYH